jgi:cobalamin biosynthesis Mg chelatase CobN
VAVHPADDGELIVDDGSRDPREDPARSAGRSASIITGVLAAVIAVCLVVLVYRYVAHTDSAASAGDRLGQVFVGADAEVQDEQDVQAVRETLMRQATQFILRLNTYGPADLDESNALPGYAAEVREVITAKLAASFDENLTLAEQTVAQAGYAREVEVAATGVESVEDDRGVVLVAGTITGSYPDTAPEAEDGARVAVEPQPFRFTVTMIRTEGEWLVDDFAPLTSEALDPEDPTGQGTTPPPAATDPPTPSTRPTGTPTQGATR